MSRSARLNVLSTDPFLKEQLVIGNRPKQPDKGPDSGDRDSLVSAPRKPIPPLNADAIAIPEPDSD
jgi:hypothetical protein